MKVLLFSDLHGHAEEWKYIPSYGDYEVSSFGRIRSLKRGTPRIMKLHTRIRDGYSEIGLRDGQSKTTFKVHRIVAVAFLGDSDLQIDHKDGNKLNNRVDNLEYVTALENIRRSFDLGLSTNSHLVGEKHHSAILTEEGVKQIWKMKGKTSGRELAKQFGVTPSSISDIHRGRTWVHVTGGVI